MGKAFQVHISMEGLDPVLMKMKKAPEVASRAAAKGCWVEAEKIMGESKDKYVPVKHGNLKTSGHVAKPKETTKFVWRIDMGYGGPAVPYAVVQHENLRYNHPHGQAKYLEVPALRAAPKIGKRVGRVIMHDLRVLQGQTMGKKG